MGGAYPSQLTELPAPSAPFDATPAPITKRSGAGAWVAGIVGRLWRIVRTNRKIEIGVGIVGVFLAIGLIGPLFITQDPNTYSRAILTRPSAAHWLGTTQLGQDVLSQLIVGTRSSILWGIATGIVVTALSVLIGLTSGYFGGVVDETLSLLINIFLVIPSLPLAIVLASYFARGPLTVALVIAVTSWAWGARVLRAQTLTMRSREFVTAARANGETTFRILFFEILPNEISIVTTAFIGATLYVILATASLEFLGLGDINSIDWGSILYWAQNDNALVLGAWWWFVPPGLFIAILGAGLALINIGIDEIADPRLRRERPLKRLLRRAKGA